MRTLITSLALVAGTLAFAQEATGTQPQTAPFEKSIYEECLLIAGTNSWQALGLSQDQVTRITDLQTRYKQGAQLEQERVLAEQKAAEKAAKKGKVKKDGSQTTATASQEPKQGEATGTQPATAVQQQAATTGTSTTHQPGITATEGNTPTTAQQPEGSKQEQDAGTTVQEPVLKDEGVPTQAQGGMEQATSASASTAQPATASYSAVDQELRTILTPAQLNIWERRCDSRTSMQH